MNIQAKPCEEYKIETSIDGYVAETTTISMPCDKSEYTQKTNLKAYVPLEVKILNKETDEFADAEITITDNATNKELVKVKTDGKYTTKLPEGSYTIQAKGENLISKKETITLNKNADKDFVLEFGLIPLSEDKTFSLGVINFEVNKAIIKGDHSFKVLDELVSIMKENPELIIEIAGHTDSDGSLKSNLTLSDNRAKVCLEYAVSKGIDLARLKSVGYGEDKPLVKNNTKENKAKNRRTEFKILN